MARIAEFKYLDDDDERIGTADYKGYAFFWAYDYRHYMRGFYQTYGVTERRVGQILQQMRRGGAGCGAEHKAHLVADALPTDPLKPAGVSPDG